MHPSTELPGSGPDSASRPATCTIGVGYWATDQDCTTVADANCGVDPATPISGTLYRATETNTWTLFYQPYTYPHPLRGEGGADATAPVIMSPLPSASQPCTGDPRNVTLSCATDENATVKYDTTDTTYDLMASTFYTTGGVSHSQVVSTACGATYTYYLRAVDGTGNKSVASTTITFTVDPAGTAESNPTTTGSGGIATFGGGASLR